MLNWKVNNDTIEFSFINDDNELVNIEVLEENLTSENFSSYLLLKELVENGQADIKDDKFFIGNVELTQLKELDQRILELPPLYPFEIRVDSDSQLHLADFSYKWYFCEHKLGQPIIAKKTGCILELETNESYILSYEQYELCEILDEYNRIPSKKKSIEINYEYFDKIKDLAIRSNSFLDEYLLSEEVILPKEIQLKLKCKDDTLEISPEINKINHQSFENIFDRYRNAKKIYNVINEEGEKTRLIFNEHQQEELNKIKKYRKIGGKLKDKIISEPNNFFDPDLINLDSFSKRVVEIGLYKPKFYPFISPYKSQWIPGIVIEKSHEERIKIPFKNLQQLEQFEKITEKAKRNNVQNIDWENNSIPIDMTDKIIDVARRQFKNQNEPLKSMDNKENKVLIIIENVDELGYEQKSNLIDLKHIYFEPPHLVKNINLLSHQKEGIAWLQNIYNENVPGCLLADDMGLGKTLQILSFIDWHNQNKNINKKPYLIVAPLSLLENWQLEYKKFFSPTIPDIFLLYGENISSNNIDELKNRLQDNLIFLTSYETIRSKFQFAICAIDYAAAFLDEAQKIKTPGTLVTNASKAIKADLRVALTGTPVENSLVDLWCIMDFAIPGLLESGKEFAKEFHNPLNKKDVDVKELGERLRDKIGIHIKRRLKKDILKDLPEKNEIRINQEMPIEQLNRYELEISQISKDSGVKNDKGKILKFISSIRDISDHPYLAEREIDKYDIDQLIKTSAKLILTKKLIEEIKSKNEKVILFTDRRETQRLLSRLLLEKFGFFASIINGDTPASNLNFKSSKLSRQQYIDKFQSINGFGAIIMSPIATGIGLNITGANNVIHYSRHWNPAKEDQATDRVYRIGQTKDVNIFYPIAVTKKFKSFDVILDEHLSRKRELANASLFPTERAEINPWDIFDDLTNEKSTRAKEVPMTIKEIDTINPFMFETLIAVIWERQGFQTFLTPKSNDKGADVIALSEKDNILLQVKHTTSKIGDNAVGEILKSRGYYENSYHRKFELGIITNDYFSLSTKEIAKLNNVKVFERIYITGFLKDNKILLNELLKKDRERK